MALQRLARSPLTARALAWHHRAQCLRAFASDSGKIKSGGFSFPAPRTLQQIVKLELLENEEPAEIQRIWENYHAEKDDCIATTMSAVDFNAIKERARSAPFFVFPVYRQGGFFNMLCQFQDTCFLVTYLEAFKENPGLAPPCLTVSLFDNLVEKKQLGLIRADVVNMLDKAESEKLLSQLIASYSDKSLFQWVDKFNNRPNEFDFEAYRKELEQ
ncbi:hypothetical protein ATCC90586_004379 [Pythium insidiosum]|nr:hypothetical protein ATCC90586_004379 [Pythium insidiosum]